MKGGNDLQWRVVSTGDSTGIQLSHLIIAFLIQPLFMNFALFLKSLELCLPMLWHIMKCSYAVGGGGRKELRGNNALHFIAGMHFALNLSTSRRMQNPFHVSQKTHLGFVSILW